MKRSLKMWSSYVLYMAVVLVVSMAVYRWVGMYGVELGIGTGVAGFLIGWVIFKREKTVENISKDGLLFESVFGVNFDVMKDAKAGVIWKDIERANIELEKYKKENNFEWDITSMFDILVVSYVDDTRKEMVVNRYKNTRGLEFQGILRVTDKKMKLDGMDLSNFDTSLISELGNCSNKECILRTIRPKETDWLKKLFAESLTDDDLKNHVYDVEIVQV